MKISAAKVNKYALTRVEFSIFVAKGYFFVVNIVLKLSHTMKNRPIVALIYDFDGTLSPGNMQEFGFIQAIGKKPQEFWQESDDIAAGQDASNILSYMKLMFDEARKAGIKLRREDFKRFGASVELFDGVKEWFKMINAYGKSKGVKIEHYINSSGLAEMIEGTEIAKNGAFEKLRYLKTVSALKNCDGGGIN